MTKHLLALLLCSGLTYAAVPSTTQWEIRTTGDNRNGGGFNAARGGTDRSQQDSPHASGTDLASSNGTTNPCVVTSATYNFTSADAGNIIHIRAGTNWTLGWYEIVSTSGNAATLDRACGSSASISDGTWRLGGAYRIGTANALTLDDAFFESGVPGNVFWIKSGTYTPGESIAISVTATAAAPYSILGYNATRGDNPTGANRPHFDLGASSIFTGQAFYVIQNMSVTGGAPTLTNFGADSVISNTKIIHTRTATNGIAFSAANDIILRNVEVVSYRGYAIACNCRVVLAGCYVHNSSVGVRLSGTAGGLTMVNSILADNYTAAIEAAAAVGAVSVIWNSTLYGAESKRGTGVLLSTGATNFRIYNSIIYGFVTGVSHADASNDGRDDFNAYYNNTTNTSNWTQGPNNLAVNPQFASVTQLTGSTATTSGSVLTQSGANFSAVTDNQDYAYIVSGTGVTVGKYLITSHTTDTITLDIAPGNSAGGDVVWQVTTGNNFAVGANMKAAGTPGAFPGGRTTGYLDIGAVQRVEPASSGGGGSFPYVQ